MKCHIDLFSGIGGFALACRWLGIKTVVFCEKDEYCQKVLAKNFGAYVADPKGIGWSDKREFGRVDKEKGQESKRGYQSPQTFTDSSQAIPIIPDIFTFDGTKWKDCWLLTGGFPCQPFSVAGKRKGNTDDRALWPEMFRIIKEARPRWVLGENVAGFVRMALDDCVSDLESEGYTVQPIIIPACAKDAPHRRDRVWIVANCDNTTASRQRGYGREILREPKPERFNVGGQDVANTERERRIGRGGNGRADINGVEKNEQTGRESRGAAPRCSENNGWLPEPNVGRVANGVPKRVDRLKCLGNAIVPQVAYEIIKGMIDSEPLHIP